ncbi:MAG TPA: UDP-N-acetylmuramoyl-tripeptide--D-alanyl-D-alanine ligase [Candidatus Sulfopaludibacter sp.]|jgi:UDP-N-acetylmuramoyl-tripeptide--D-alanyl-D-alanine ligase|nr:UDP-N-acetylmuramoyl-tripeptide--D-alanyl-D-alanine ligase [Candidatus Sulfopaludibacter sp.]
MTFDLQEVARAMRARGDVRPVSVSGWSVDTRTQNPGDVYFALHGPNHDGHDYVAKAVAQGASGVVVDRAVAAPGELLVPDTLRALQSLGNWARETWSGTVIGVTGSAGKTTTKDAIAHLLAVDLPVGKTIGNFNNHVGVPLSILRLPDGCRAGVLEMGMNHAGEIRELAAIARPNFGVVTNVGYAHVEFFDSIEGVAAAKRELIEALPADGVAVLNGDDVRVREFGRVHGGRSVTFGYSEGVDVRAEVLSEGAAGSRFRTLGVEFETTQPGRHAVMNLLAAIAVAREFEIAPERLPDAVHSFTTGKMRGQRSTHNGITVWDDCYNANPEAMQSMLDVLRETPAARRIAVLGEMLELGHAAEELHRRVGRYAAEQGIDLLIGVRGNAREMVNAAVGAGLPESAALFFNDATEAGDYVRRVAQPGDAILFKGSRGVQVERALGRFQE